MADTLNLEHSPVLAFLFAAPEKPWYVEHDLTPFECCHCPFATEETRFHDPANPADPGEGHYECALLGLTGTDAVWGENPKCSPEQWRDRVRAELRDLSTRAYGEPPETLPVYAMSGEEWEFRGQRWRVVMWKRKPLGRIVGAFSLDSTYDEGWATLVELREDDRKVEIEVYWPVLHKDGRRLDG